MLISTIDFYRFIPLSLILILPGGTRLARSRTYWLHFLAQFSSDQEDIWCGEEIQAEHIEISFALGFVKQGK